MPFTDLIERELSENNVDLKQGVFCDWHELFKLEDEVFSLANLKEKAKKSFNEALESIPDLNLRRQQKAKLILRGKFRGNQIEELIRQNQETVLREALAKLPEIAPIFGPGGMYDAIFGRVKPDAFRNLAKETLLHPAVLAKLSFHPEFDLKPVSNFFWDQADKLVDLINKQIVQASELQSKTGMHFDYFIVEMEKYFLSEEFFRDTISKSNPGAEFDVALALGTKNIIGMLAQLSLIKLKAHANQVNKVDFLKNPKLKQGDFGDAMHSLYQPYVDIFCCDRRTKVLLEKFAPMPQNICCSESELISRLQA